MFKENLLDWFNVIFYYFLKLMNWVVLYNSIEFLL